MRISAEAKAQSTSKGKKTNTHLIERTREDRSEGIQVHHHRIANENKVSDAIKISQGAAVNTNDLYSKPVAIEFE